MEFGHELADPINHRLRRPKGKRVAIEVVPSDPLTYGETIIAPGK